MISRGPVVPYENKTITVLVNVVIRSRSCPMHTLQDMFLHADVLCFRMLILLSEMRRHDVTVTCHSVRVTCLHCM